MADLRLTLVTPEKTLFDKPATSIRVPLFDGSAGIYPGRAPMVGRLGVGVLKLNSDEGSDSYFIEGGFIQIKGGQVSVLTNAAEPVSGISRSNAQSELESATALKAVTDDQQAEREAKVDRARKLLSAATQE